MKLVYGIVRDKLLIFLVSVEYCRPGVIGIEIDWIDWENIDMG